MGFKELEVFNISLLTKMVVMVLIEPDALCVKLIKDLYFVNSEFMKATKGAQTSWE